MPPTERPIMSVREAAALIGITESTAYRWLERGELAGATRVGNRWYVRRAALLRWCEANDDPPAGPPAERRLRAVV